MAQFTDEQLDEIWEKVKKDSSDYSGKMRKDACGAWMKRDKYGDRNSSFGWEVDHIYPKSKLEDAHVPDDLINNMTNLRPLHWKNNDSKDADYPHYESAVTAGLYRIADGKVGYSNIPSGKGKTINVDVQQRIKKLFSGYDLKF